MGIVRLGSDQLSVALDGDAPSAGAALQLMVRPDWASLGGDLRATVVSVMYRGPHTDYRLATPGGELELRVPGPPRVAAGESVQWTLRRAWILAPQPIA